MKIRLFALLLVLSSHSFADVILKGYHAVTRKVCFRVEPDGPRLVVWVNNQVSVEPRHQYLILRDRACPDQGYKNNYVRLYRVDSNQIAQGFPPDEVNPDTLAGWIPVVNLREGQWVASNSTTLKDSIPDNYQEWSYSIRGSWYAFVLGKQGVRSSNGTVTFTTVSEPTVVWPEYSRRITRQGEVGLNLVSVSGPSVRLTIPNGEPAALRVVAPSGKILGSLRVASTQGLEGSVDLGWVPPSGSVVELRRGASRSTYVVGLP